VVGNDVGGRPKGVWPEKNAKIPQVAKVNYQDFSQMGAAGVVKNCVLAFEKNRWARVLRGCTTNAKWILLGNEILSAVLKFSNFC
jgi:hypothetical protein